MRKIFLIFLLIFSSHFLYSQEDTSTVLLDTDARVYCNPKLEGMGPSKGIVLSYYRSFAQDIQSESLYPPLNNASADIRRNNKLNFKLRLPVWNKPSFKILLGFEYEYQEYVFENHDPSYELYRNLQQKHLKTIGGNINVLKSLDETHYLVFQVKGDLNGDYSTEQLPTIDFLKASFSALYGIKKCPTKTHGYGLYYNYTFGRQMLLPAFLYNNTLNKRWGVELLLPASAKVRYNFNYNTLLYVGAEVDGANYNLVMDNPPLSDISNLQLQKSAIRFTLEFNREIHDWLWFGVSGGLSQPISFNLTEGNNRAVKFDFERGLNLRRRDPIIRNRLSTVPFMEASIFIVPPRKLENKILNAR